MGRFTDEVLIELKRGSVRIVVSNVSAAIRSLTVENREVIPLDTDEARVNWFSGVTLAPWPNRLADATWQHDGKTYQGEINEGLGHALHGLVYDRTFEIESQSDDSIEFGYTLGSDDIYPFPLRIRVKYQLTDEGVSSVLSAENLGETKAPVALGAHPYFPFEESTSITLTAKSVLENDGRKIPTGKLLPATSSGVTCCEPRIFDGFNADDCFVDLDCCGEKISTELKYADGSVTTVWQEAPFDHLMVFTKRDFPWADGIHPAVGIEPQTAPANALASGVGLRWLELGETFSARWGINSEGSR